MMTRRVLVLAGLLLLTWLGYALVRQVTQTESWRASVLFPGSGVAAAICVTSLLVSAALFRRR